MGKIRRVRQKFHLAAVKAKSEEKKVKFAIDEDNRTQVGVAALESNIFSGLNIKLNELVRCLPNFQKSNDDVTPAPSAVDRVHGRERIERIPTVSKKEKIKFRHKAFLQKLQAAQEARKNVKVNCQRQKTVITRDTQSLFDSFPAVDSVKPVKALSNLKKTKNVNMVLGTKKELPRPDVFSNSKILDSTMNNVLSKKPATNNKRQKMKTFKQQQKQMLADLETFRQVKEHPEFKEKPEATIMKHLHYKFKYANM